MRIGQQVLVCALGRKASSFRPAQMAVRHSFTRHHNNREYRCDGAAQAQ
jgi:hypothetical protein